MKSAKERTGATRLTGIIPRKGDVLVMKDEREYDVVGVRGKYILCHGTQWRRNNPDISHYLRRNAQRDGGGEDEG